MNPVGLYKEESNLSKKIFIQIGNASNQNSTYAWEVI